MPKYRHWIANGVALIVDFTFTLGRNTSRWLVKYPSTVIRGDTIPTPKLVQRFRKKQVIVGEGPL